MNQQAQMNVAPKKSGSKFFMTYFVTILILIVAGRAMSYLCTLSSTNIAFPAWVEPLSSYLATIIDSIRRSISYSAVVFAVFAYKNSSRTLVSVSLLTLLDFAVRYLIDLLTSAIEGTELLTAIWLGTNYIYELVFIILAFIVARIIKMKHDSTDNTRKKRRYSVENAAIIASVMYCISRVVSELLYLIDFLVSYVDITNTEIASIVGSFLEIFVIYGGVSCIAAYIVLPIFKKTISRSTVRE